MKNIPLFVGMDYHEKNVQVCVLEPGGDILMNSSLPNDWQRIQAAAQRFGVIQRAALEACCGAANLAQELIDKAGWKTELAHPGYVSRMKQSVDKTDSGDGFLLADLTRVGYLPKVWLAPENIRELRRLTRYRQQLADRKRDVKLRIGALLRENRVKGPMSPTGPIKAWRKPWVLWLKVAELPEQSRWVLDNHLLELEWLGHQIGQAEKRLRVVTADDPVVKMLMSFKGIGEVTAWVMRAEIGEFGRFNSGKELSRFCGLTPCNASSGQKQADSGLVKAGNSLLKSILIEAGLRLIRSEERWKALAQRLKSKGKPGSVVSAAVANRWVRWLYYRVIEMQETEGIKKQDNLKKTA
jgi:transposase